MGVGLIDKIFKIGLLISITAFLFLYWSSNEYNNHYQLLVNSGFMGVVDTKTGVFYTIVDGQWAKIDLPNKVSVTDKVKSK